MKPTAVRERIFRVLSFLLGVFLCGIGVFLFTRPEVQGWVRILVAAWMVGFGVFLVRFGLTGRPEFKRH